ncbi:anti-phage BREX system Lon protease BrxL [Dehalobacterium formicoaceticum]|uniref:BREX system Lon protease-like protein BrxL n=1 Tax=Dehalobacterium formicoaceticum TaxID=51515 RepID=A0ABT1Y3A6_9FIRM|nr:anti-phage BREX system Lon protease BrxL [Dehalobacterium formicoaceticum]MCR6544419.1 BREX system Lon protease-like protein BrxL [Dehalobacterium formicoaceticum]
MDEMGQMDQNVGLNEKLNTYFPGRVVRKDLTIKIKEGANVPVFIIDSLKPIQMPNLDLAEIFRGV